MERLTFVRPPFDRRGVAEIDRRMLAAAGDRVALREKWEKGLGGKGKTAVAGEAEISKKPTRFAMLNVLHLVLVSLIWSALCAGLLRGLILSGSSARPFGILLACLLTAGFLWAGEKLCRRIVVHLSPMRSAKTLARCVLETFQEGGLIGPEAALAVECDEQGVAAEFSLKNASVYEQNLFAQAAAELFSPIRNPRFLLIGRGLPGFRYACSLACPSAIGEDKKLAGILAACQSGAKELLLSPCDYPNLTTQSMRVLAGQPMRYLQVAGKNHYTLAYFQTDQETVQAWLSGGQRRLQDFLKGALHCQPLVINADPKEFTNHNQRSSI